MKISYLKQWTSENNLKGYSIKSIKKSRNLYGLIFKKSSDALFISLSGSENFCFISNKADADFKDDTKLSTLNEFISSFVITNSYIDDADRIIFIDLKKTDIFNKEITRTLILELIPYSQNIIVTENSIIKESIKKIPLFMNASRQILPGLKYELPVRNFVPTFEPIIYPLGIDDSGKIVETGVYNDMNSLLKDFYFKYLLQKDEKLNHKRKISQIKKEIKKKKKKLLKLEKDKNQYENQKEWKTYLELLKSVYNKINKGMENIEVTNYFDENLSKITIPLNLEFNARQNVEYYAKKYKKSVSGKEIVKKQIKKTLDEIAELEIKIENIENSHGFIEEISKKSSKSQTKSFKSIKINNDWEIVIGRTKTENDIITTKMSKPNDWWFHTRIFRGTHVLLRNFAKKEPSTNLIYICAGIAAYHSKAKKSSNVPVDYTQIRYVRKPKGSPAGFVTYKNQKTIYIDPIDERKARELLKNGGF